MTTPETLATAAIGAVISQLLRHGTPVHTIKAPLKKAIGAD
jgi:hypothetical protein